MKVYLVESDVEHYESLILTNLDDDLEISCRFDGMVVGSSWRPLEVEICREEDDETKYSKGDFPNVVGLEDAFVLSRHAADVLTPFLVGNGELLQLICTVGDFFAFNVTCLSNALNLDQSKVVYFSTGRIMNIEQSVLDANKIPSNDIFKLSQMPYWHIFVSEKFKLAVEQNKLRGLLFKPVKIIR